MTDAQLPPSPTPPPFPQQVAVQPAAGTNSLAIVAFVLSIAGFVTVGSAFVGAIVCGHIALSQIKRTRESGRGLAVAALVIGYTMVGLVLIAVTLILVLIAVSVSNGHNTFVSST